MDKIKDTITIKIDNLPIQCYIADNGVNYLGSNVERLFKTKPLKSPVMLLNGNEEIQGYTIDAVLDNLKSKNLKSLAKIGLNNLTKGDTMRVCDLSDDIIAYTEPEMSKFDKLMKKALDFNPNEDK